MASSRGVRFELEPVPVVAQAANTSEARQSVFFMPPSYQGEIVRSVSLNTISVDFFSGTAKPVWAPTFVTEKPCDFGWEPDDCDTTSRRARLRARTARGRRPFCGRP